MQCVKPIRIKGPQGTYSFKGYPDGLLVPCGKCIACRIRKREEWTIRLLHEMCYHSESIFVTLTYNDESVPKTDKGYLTLKKKHLQDYMKRLRITMDRCNYKTKIKYFACGEYGEKTGRPHYHLIIFGLGLKDREMISRLWAWSDWNIVHMRNCFGTVTRDSIRYVAQYIEKKLVGKENEERSYATGQEQEFRLSSKGIGEQYVRMYEDELKDKKYITNRGVKMGLPRYYIDKLGINKDDMIDMLYKKQSDIIEKMSGERIHYDAAYRQLSAEKNVVIEKRKESAKQQSEKNVLAKLSQKQKKL